MTDMNGTTPTGAPAPQNGGEHVQQPAYPAQPVHEAHGQQSYYYQQPAPAGNVTYQKKGGGRTFLIAFAGALLA